MGINLGSFKCISKNNLPYPVIASKIPGELLSAKEQFLESTSQQKINIVFQQVVIALGIIGRIFEVIIDPTYKISRYVIKVQGKIIEKENKKACPPGMGDLKANLKEVDDETTVTEFKLKMIGWLPFAVEFKGICHVE